MSQEIPDPAVVRSCLERITASSAFAHARRDQEFLRFICEETLAGGGAELKESRVASRVFDRKADFDPRLDSIVRVVGSHVRKRLVRYYQSEGAADPVVISLPRGGYTPHFERAPGATAAPRPVRWLRLSTAVAAGVLGGLAIGYLAGNGVGRPDRTAMLVVPFAALDGSPESRRLADALSEDLTTELARSGKLRVVARTTSLLYRNQGVDVRTIGDRLGVGSLLEGSVRRQEGEVKITAQLVELGGGYHLWSESYAGPVERLPEFQEAIAQAVRSRLGDATDPRKPTRPASMEAQEAYYQARLLLRRGAEGRKAAVPLLERAVAVEPGYTAAWAALATAYSTLAFHEEGPLASLVPKAKAAGRRTLDLDPDSAEACVALGSVAYARDHDWAAAELWFRRALAASPNYARARTAYGLFLITRGRADEGLGHLRTAHRLDPLSSMAGNDLAVVLWCARRYREAVATAGRTLAVQPDFAAAHVVRGLCLTELREYDASAAELDRALAALGREPAILGAIGYRHGRAGKREAAEQLLHELLHRGAHFHAAVVAAGMDDRRRALDLLSDALQRGETDAVFFPSHPAFVRMYGHPGFRTLLARVGL